MIQPPPPVGSTPVLGAVAPPRIKPRWWRSQKTVRVNPTGTLLQSGQFLHFNRRMRYHIQQLPVRPHIFGQRRYIEITKQNSLFARLKRLPVLQFIQELQLVSEFRIHCRIRNVSARRNIEIMNRNP